MNTISGKIIDRTWKRINDSTSEDIEKLTRKFLTEQPIAGAYLMAVEEVLMPEKERINLHFIGLILWEIISAKRGPMRQVTQEDIEAAEAVNLKFLEDLEAGSEMDYQNGMQKLAANYNQWPLLSSVVEELMPENEDEPDSAPESVGIALLHLKTILDCFDKA